MELHHKIALVTGGAHRLGKVLALRLAQAGAGVVIHYHHAEAEAQTTLEELRALTGRGWLVQADLTTQAGIDTVFEYIEQTVGGVDILINSAAVMAVRGVPDVTRADWDETLNLNLAAPFFCAQRAARSMSARGSGNIINVADTAGLKPSVHRPVHSISKAGVIMLTQVLAQAYAPHIRVNALAPGLVLKPDHLDDARWQALGQNTLLKRAGSGYDVAHAMMFLLENEYMTGETLVIDGGSQIHR